MRGTMRSSLVIALSALLLGGCVEERTLRPNQPLYGGHAASTEGGLTTDPSAANRPTPASGRSMSLGVIPFDDFALPLVSPDGHLAATHTGRTPPLKSVLARDGAVPPDDTAIEIYQLSVASRKPASLGLVPAAALMGRSVDDQGFLVESIQSDGSRWIGKAMWLERKVRWLVTDENVNAFGVLGPDGALAWSRRTTRNREFDLVLALGDREWTTENVKGRAADIAAGARTPPNASLWNTDGASWLFPVFDGSSSDLLALRLKSGTLDLVRLHADEASDQLVEGASVRLADEADDFVAYQTFASIAQAPIPAEGQTADSPGVLFFNPRQRCINIWPPGEAAPRPLLAGSIAAVPASIDQIVVTTGEDLYTVRADAAAEPRSLLHGNHVPRRSSRGGREIISAIPAGRGRIEMSVLQWSSTTSAVPVAGSTGRAD
jgi:hypothetical protein